MKFVNRIYIVFIFFFCLIANNGAKASIIKSVGLSLPGTLKTYFTSSEKSSVTNLIISGNMNTVDFDFIRSSLSKLVVLDLRNAMPEHAEIPEEAFYTGLGTNLLDSVYLPSTLTKIGDRAFSECEKLSMVVIPTTLTDIGEEAFEDCSKLDSVCIPSTLIYLGESAFSGCTSLRAITFTQGLSIIGMYAFESCESLQSIQIPASVKYIGQYAFSSCSELSSVQLTEGLDSIGLGAFAFCTKLDTISIPASVKSIGLLAFAFSTCSISVASENNYLKVEDGILYNHDMTVLLECPTFRTGTVIVPETVDTVEMGAFGYCALLTEIQLPSRLRAIKGYGFCYCIGLQSMILPDSLSYIGSGAFAGFPALHSVSPGNPYFVVVDSVLFNKSMTRLIHYPIFKSGPYVVPESVEVLTASAFESCSGLTSLTLSYHLKTIERDALYGCDALTSIYLTNSNPIVLDQFFIYDLSSEIMFYVPRGSLNEYLNADVWSGFFGQLKEWDVLTSLPNMNNQDVRIRVINGELIIDGVKEGSSVSVYSIKGLPIRKLTTTDSEEIRLPLPSKGLWLVKVGNKTYKVIN